MGARKAVEKHQLVRIRAARWRVAEIHEYEACTRITVSGADAATSGAMRGFLLPFEDVDPIARSDRRHPVQLRRWRQACRALLASDAPPGALRSAAAARIDILAHQLDPVIAVLHGRGCRVLLADDVGLGKTIQASLIVSELCQRQCAERVLVITPSGLKAQWTDELVSRFGLSVFDAGARSLRELAATLPVGFNPWRARPVAVASVDYVKRAEVLPAITGCHWDLVVVDEAHGVAGDSDRRAAVERLAAHAAYVVLLTATPHNGDEAAYRRLCAIGSVGDEDPLLVFRRSRQEVRAHAKRRVRVRFVRPSRPELRMFAALERYQAAVQAEQGDRALALSVLSKRAFSSAWALAATVERRLASLQASAGDASQQRLPLDDDAGELDREDEAPVWPVDLALADCDRERQLLQAVADAAREAARAVESKIAALIRLLGRARESAIVFTEYRDTAAHVRAALGRGLLLHGGLTPAERQAVVSSFDRARNDILITTDAAGQGLNLQRAARLVVNLELPWNPMRLEQRIGRVDRIGQTRRVHVLHLVGRGTGERAVLDRLQERIARAREEISAPDPLHNPVDGRPNAPQTFSPEAAAEAARLAFCRSLVQPLDAEVYSDLEAKPWWEARSRRRTLARTGNRAIFVYRISVNDETGSAVATRVIGVAGRLTAPLESQSVLELCKKQIGPWLERTRAIHHRFWARRIGRERAITALACGGGSMFQPALFDRRAQLAHDRALERLASIQEDLGMRLARAEQRASLEDPDVRLLLALVP
jgi:superfamily II DNA or RNA helicase